MKKVAIPKTLEEFKLWGPEDGFKYQWNNSKLIKVIGINKRQVFIFAVSINLFIESDFRNAGKLISKYEV